MEERVTRGISSKDGNREDDTEIIDIADLLEDSPPSPADDASDLRGPDLEAIGAVDFEVQADEDPIDLDDIFSELDEAGGDPGDEDIIDLVEVVDEAEAEDTLPPVDVGTDDELRLDEVDDFSFEDFDLEPPEPEGAEDGLDLEEDFIAAFELEEILSDTPKSQEGTGMSADVAPESQTVDVDLIDSFDLDLSEALDDMIEEGEAAASGPKALEGGAGLLAAAGGLQPPDAAAGLPPDIRVTEEQIDAAVERVIRKMAADKIDDILVEAIEKAVSREISRLKKIINS